MPKTVLVSALAVAALSFAAVPALAQASGDGFQGPRVFSDSVLDQSIAAMNRNLAIAERRADLLAGVVTPSQPDFSTLSVALRDVTAPDLEGPVDIAAYDTEVTGDGSLEAAIAQINGTISDRDSQLFIQIARAASGGLDQQFDHAPETITAFGPQIGGDATLDAKMVHVLDLVAVDDAGTIIFETSALAFSDASLDAMTAAWSTPRVDL